MRIGIITIVLNENYGGILQAYALQKVLKDMGHNVTHIDRWRGFHMTFWGKCLSYPKRFIQKHLFGKDIAIRPDVKIENDIKIISTHTRHFIDKHIKRIITKDFTNIKRGDFDAFVVGSDQIWRARASRPQLNNVYLEFAKDWEVKRIAYAASFGTDEWEYTPEETTLCSNLIKLFNVVTVREKSAVSICKERYGINATFVLDPTMLVNRETYNKLFIDSGTPQSDGELFCYILDKSNEKDTLITDIANKTGYKPFYVNSKYQDITAPIAERIQPKVEEWLRAFYDAKFVITDSFHACVFSIIYNKPFIVYKNETRGNTRFDSLLQTFNLEDRAFTKERDTALILNSQIDWSAINKTLQTLKESSYKILKSSLM